MTAYDKLYEDAAENYGLITTDMAARYGVSAMALVMLAQRGRLRHIARGVYRLEQHPASEYDMYATLVARAGKGAFLWGPSVLALNQLCPTDPAKLYVGAPGRIRRNLGRGIIVKNGCKCSSIVQAHGIASQTIADAILDSRGIIMNDRLISAARRAQEEGFLLPDAAQAIIRGLNNPIGFYMAIAISNISPT